MMLINNIMRILNHDGNIKLSYSSKIVKKQRKYTKKNGDVTITPFYQAYFPEELIEYLQVKENTLYFYEQEKKVFITGVEPTDVDSVKIKVQSANQFSIPKKLFPFVNDFDNINLKIDFAKYDNYLGQYGLLMLKLK